MSDTAVDPQQSTDRSLHGSPERTLPGDGSRVPALIYAAIIVASIPFWFWMGRQHWFFFDDWNVLTDRDGGSLSSLLRPHNEHWATVPIVVFRVLWNIVGLHHYWPYQAMAILGHGAVAALLFVIMRRVGVNPWLAAAAGSLFVFFGSGSQNIVWAFQIAFVWALAFGLLQLCLADHDGVVDWRDYAAIASGLIALMCSGVGLTMLIAVGVAIWLRRGWRRAALQAVPLAAVYGLWFLAYGHGQGNPTNSPTSRQIVDFVWAGLRATYHGLGQLAGAGPVLAAVLAAGFVLLWRSDGTRRLLTKRAVPIALLGCSIAFLFSAAALRADVIGADPAGSRYLYVVAALSIPAIATAVDAIARRWLVAFPLGLALLLVPIPRSISGARHLGPYALGDPTVLVVPDLPGAADLPPDTYLDPRGEGSGNFTVGWLLQARADGDAPAYTGAGRSAAELNWHFRLSLRQTSDPAPDACEPIVEPLDLSFDAGETFGIAGGPVVVRNAEPGGSPLLSTTFNPALGETIEVMLPATDIRLSSASHNQPAALCRSTPG
jgi:hypothetical protein